VPVAESITVQAFGVASTSWSETAVTWNSQPGPSTGALASVVVSSTTSQWYEWDVTSYVQSERAAGVTPQADESIRGFITQLDAAIKQPSSDRLFTLVAKNNLKRFVQGLTVSRPASWATEILHVDQVDSNRVAVDVGLKVKSEGRDQSGTAVFVLSRAGSTWLLEDVPNQLFNVK